MAGRHSTYEEWLGEVAVTFGGVALTEFYGVSRRPHSRLHDPSTQARLVEALGATTRRFDLTQPFLIEQLIELTDEQAQPERPLQYQNSTDEDAITRLILRDLRRGREDQLDEIVAFYVRHPFVEPTAVQAFAWGTDLNGKGHRHREDCFGELLLFAIHAKRGFYGLAETHVDHFPSTIGAPVSAFERTVLSHAAHAVKRAQHDTRAPSPFLGATHVARLVQQVETEDAFAAAEAARVAALERARAKATGPWWLGGTTPRAWDIAVDEEFAESA